MSEALQRLIAKAKPQGSCMFCGPGTFARHRLWDSVDERQRIDGWDYPRIAREFPSVSAEEARDVRAAFAGARRAHRALPGRAA